MQTQTSQQSLTATDLKDNLRDIQDNVVAPILMTVRAPHLLQVSRRREGARVVGQHVQARQCAAAKSMAPDSPSMSVSPTKALRRSDSRNDRSTAFLEAFRAGMRARATGRWAISDRTRRNSGRAVWAVPTFTRWRGFAPIPMQGREEATRIIRAEMEATGGIEIRFIQDTMALAHENGIGSEGEHFGFADPISQPPIEGADMHRPIPATACRSRTAGGVH